MEKSLLKKLPFSHPNWDEILHAWLMGELSPSLRNLLEERLSLDSTFREQCSEWIKSLRDPGSAHRHSDASESKKRKSA